MAVCYNPTPYAGITRQVQTVCALPQAHSQPGFTRLRSIELFVQLPHTFQLYHHFVSLDMSDRFVYSVVAIIDSDHGARRPAGSG